MKHVINAKQLRASLPDIVKRVRWGDQYTVLYRSHPAFRIVGIDPDDDIPGTLAEDPLYGAGAVGDSMDALTGADHDLTLYGTQQ